MNTTDTAAAGVTEVWQGVTEHFQTEAATITVNGRRYTTKEGKPAHCLEDIDRDKAIQLIRAGLKKRGYRFSVTGGRGTAWGWIHIDLMPAAFKAGMTEDQRRAEYRRLQEALNLRYGLGSGEGVAASSDYYWEYVDRANGLPPAKPAEPYWD